MKKKEDLQSFSQGEEKECSLGMLEKMGEIALFCSKLSFVLHEWEFVTDSLKQQRNEILRNVEGKIYETNAKKEAMEMQMKEWIALEKKVISLQEEEKNLLFGIEILKRRTEKLEKKKIDFEMLLEELKKELGGIASSKKNLGKEEKTPPPEEEKSYDDIYNEDEDEDEDDD